MIFFDIDDTLFDNSGAEIKAARRFHQETRGLEHFQNPEDFVYQWRATTEIYLQRFIDKKISFQDQRRHRLRDIFKRSFSHAEADALFNEYLKYYEENWELFADVLPCLDKLSSLALGIISNGNSSQHAMEEHVEIQSLARLYDILDRFVTAFKEPT